MKHYFVFFTLLFFSFFVHAQTITQNIRGTIVDADSEMPLIGVTIVLDGSEPFVGTTTDLDGNFKLANVPIGRVNLKISYVGYEDLNLGNLLLTSGKELVLDLKMTEGFAELDVYTVIGSDNGEKPLNEMATVSARSFSVEETQRYAASAYDPARMVATYAGVSNAGDDLANEISIRGNSPKGIMWRLEGIEVPNPNHFGSAGGSGGGISMLSSSTLATSDFYTGAFPAEFGNATSGVFDMKLRNGNNEKREHAIMVGALGIEAATEGYFKKGSAASYLINYRYSTLGLVSLAFPVVGDVLPAYQDVSFKINVPTQKAGTFALFGLGGINKATLEADADSTLWEYSDDNESFVEDQKIGIIGLKHTYYLSNKTYLRTIFAYSQDDYTDEYSILLPEEDYRKDVFDFTTFKNSTARISTMLNHKFNSQNTLRAGYIGSQIGYDFKYDARTNAGTWINFINSDGNAFLNQAYVQWKHKANAKLTLNGGIHFTHFALNGSYAIDPRFALQYEINNHQSFSISTGLHSKPEHISTYFLNSIVDGVTSTSTPNKELGLTQSAQAVVGYSHRFHNSINLSVEAYYQHQFNVPVENDSSSRHSILNSADIWSLMGRQPLVNEGEGANYGLDITLQKPLNNLYYYLVTGSIYKSTYTTLNGASYNSRYNGRYSLNLLGGKEFKVGKSKKNLIGLNGKFILKGGNRYTPIDLEASQAAGQEIRLNDQPFGDQAVPYYRFDIGFSYKINRPKATHSILFDIQNVTNRANIWVEFYHPEANEILADTQTGLFPFFNYRVEF